MTEKKLKVYCETSFWSYLNGRQTPLQHIGVWIMTNDIEFEDPIEEVYVVRRKISSRYGNNIRKIVEAAREWMKQDESEGRVYVTFPSARIAPAMG